MKNHPVSSFIAVVLCSLIVGCKSEDTDLDEYEVLSLAIVHHVSFGEPGGPYMLDEHPSISLFLFDNDERKALDELQQTLSKSKHVGPELAEKLIEAQVSAAPFMKEKFPEGLPVDLLPRQAKEDLFRGGNDEGWNRFYEEYRHDGIVTASKPVFSQDRKTAVVLIWHQRASLIGEGRTLILKRIGRVWSVYEAPDAASPVSMQAEPENSKAKSYLRIVAGSAFSSAATMRPCARSTSFVSSVRSPAR